MAAWAEAEYIIDSLSTAVREVFGGGKLKHIGNYTGNATVDVSFYLNVNPSLTADDFIVIVNGISPISTTILKSTTSTIICSASISKDDKIQKTLSNNKLSVTGMGFTLGLMAGDSVQHQGGSLNWELYVL